MSETGRYKNRWFPHPPNTHTQTHTKWERFPSYNAWHPLISYCLSPIVIIIFWLVGNTFPSLKLDFERHDSTCSRNLYPRHLYISVLWLHWNVVNKQCLPLYTTMFNSLFFGLIRRCLSRETHITKTTFLKINMKMIWFQALLCRISKLQGIWLGKLYGCDVMSK